MDKIGDYIPLIIIALSFIYSIAKKAGKKAVTEDNDSEITLPEDLSENAETWPQVNPSSKKQLQKRSKVVIEKKRSRISEKRKWDSVETIPDNVFSGEMNVTSAFDINSIEEERMNESDTSRIRLSFDDVDELKKGILYAEIFNRKY